MEPDTSMRSRSTVPLSVESVGGVQENSSSGQSHVTLERSEGRENAEIEKLMSHGTTRVHTKSLLAIKVGKAFGRRSKVEAAPIPHLPSLVL